MKAIVFRELESPFDTPSAKTEDQVRAALTQVALGNAVMASLPGRMGVGVFLSMALEAWMAFRAGTLVGIKYLNKTSDVLKYLELVSGIVGVIGWGFVHILNLVFSLLVRIPGLPVKFTAERLVTDFVGVFFWLGFDETKDQGSLAVPRCMWGRARRLTWDLYSYQIRFTKDLAKMLLTRTGTSPWVRELGSV